jgi:putative ABC transport system permease protein
LVHHPKPAKRCSLFQAESFRLRINSLNLTPTHDRLLERLNSIPGVLAAGSMTSLPLTGQPSDVYLMNRLPSDGSATPPPPANLRTVSLDSFGILGIRLKQGRFFTKADTEKAPRVLIINEALARRLWPGEDPVGRRMSLKFKTVIWGSGDMQYAEGEVVGVIRDVKYDGPETGAPLEAYLPFAQRFREHYLTSLVLRCAVAPGALANSVRKEIEAVDASYQVETVEDVQDLYADATASRRFLMVLLSVFAAVAFGLSVVGIYGVVAFTVSRRMREVGIRMALGARPSEIVTLILKQTMPLILIGLALGLTAAFGLRQVIASQLFGVSPLDPVTLAVGIAVVVAALLAACYLPARRAAKADPMTALRCE